MKRKAPNTARVAGEIRRNVTTLPARPVSDFKLTPAEIRSLPDPEWVTEDDADAIMSARILKSEKTIPLEQVLKEFGRPLDRRPRTER